MCGADEIAVAILTHDGSADARANVDVIAHAPTDLAALCSLVEQQAAEIARVTGERDVARAKQERADALRDALMEACNRLQSDAWRIRDGARVACRRQRGGTAPSRRDH